MLKMRKSRKLTVTPIYLKLTLFSLERVGVSNDVLFMVLKLKHGLCEA